MMKKLLPLLYRSKTLFPSPVRHSSSLYQRSGCSHQQPARERLFGLKDENVTVYQNYSVSAVTMPESIKLRNDHGICWKCRCGTVLPVKSGEDYFTLFDMKPAFQLSQDDLQKKFKRLQVTLHPDKFTLKSPTESQISESVSSLLNKAYFTLLKPLARGLYLLELQGMTLGEDVSSDDPEFLLEIMEQNEAIADTTSIDDLRDRYVSVKAEVETLSDAIAESFKGGQLIEAKSQLIRFKYFDNILEKLKERLPPI